MKNSKLPLILLPIAILALVWALPVRMMQNSTHNAQQDAASRRASVSELEAKAAYARRAKANEAQLLAQLKQIRAVLPNVPEQYLTPVINVLSDTAAKHNVRFVEQNQVSPIPAATADGATASAAPDPGGQPAVEAPKQGTVKIQLVGTMGDVIAFLGDIPASQRLFVQHVAIKPPTNATDFGFDAAAPIEAEIDFNFYAAASATNAAPGS